MKIAIVILNWNGKTLLEQFLPAVIARSEGADIYVADNASADDSIAYVQTSFPSVQIVQNTQNWGFAKGYNEALQHIDADLYCLLNSDIEVAANWLAPIAEQFEREPNTAIIQPKILDHKDASKFEYAGAAGGFIDKLGYPYCRGRIFQSIEKDTGQYDDVKDIFWATGACMFIRKEVFWLLNGFDEDYFAHQEEVDLCWRAHNRGYNVQYVGASKVYHVGGATMHNMNPQKTFLNFRNSLYSITKNLPKRYVASLIFMRLLLDAVAGARFLCYFQLFHFWAIIRAHLSYYANLSKTLKKRGNTKKFQKYHGVTSIVWSYFVKGRKAYSLLNRN